MVIKDGVDFESLDGEPVTLLFLIAAPDTKDNVHLDVLSKLSMMLMDEEFTKNLRNASTAEEFLEIIDKADEEKKSVDERLSDITKADDSKVKYLQLHPVLQESPILIWRLRDLKKQQRQRIVISR